MTFSASRCTRRRLLLLCATMVVLKNRARYNGKAFIVGSNYDFNLWIFFVPSYISKRSNLHSSSPLNRFHFLDGRNPILLIASISEVIQYTSHPAYFDFNVSPISRYILWVWA